MKTSRGNQRTSLRLQARHLIVVKGFSQLEASKAVGVSQQTMCKWNKMFNWSDQELKAIKRKGGMTVVFADFLDYVRSCEPSIHSDVKKLWDNFLRKTEKTGSKNG